MALWVIWETVNLWENRPFYLIIDATKIMLIQKIKMQIIPVTSVYVWGKGEIKHKKQKHISIIDSFLNEMIVSVRCFVQNVSKVNCTRKSGFE